MPSPKKSSFSLLRRLSAPLFTTDRVLLVVVALLLGIGFLFVYGIGQELGGGFAAQWRKQLVWIGLGLGVCFFVLIIDYHLTARWSWTIYLIGNVLLLLVFSPLGQTINGAQSWIRIAGQNLQPSELAKPATLIFTAWVVSHDFWDGKRVPPWLPAGICLAPPFLLVLKQPDWGTALVFLPVGFAIVFLAGLKWHWLVLGTLLLFIITPLAYPRLKEHQKNRIRVFIEEPAEIMVKMAKPMLDKERGKRFETAAKEFTKRSGKTVNTDWNSQQSLLAVGSGGFSGKGFMAGTQHVLGYLPKTVSSSDFIFSVIAEETGFLGSSLVVLLELLLILCCLRIAFAAADSLGRLIAAGVAMIFFIHTLINVGMTVRAAPIIGIPLPFISYGGSSMLGMMILVGLVLSVDAHKKDPEETEA